ncbi:hypothetical protein ACOSQ3_000877 [Xanthoceras sorbifolium]
MNFVFLDIVSWASSFLDKVRAVVAPIDLRLVSRCKDVKWKPPKVVHGLTKFGLFFVNNFVWLEDCPFCVTNLILNNRSR